MSGSGDRIVVVTGGSRGIGRAICAALSAPGTTVYFNYNSNLDAAQTTAQGIETAGGKACYHQVDVASESAVSDYLGTVLKASGRIDVLVNN
ncbi:MAG: SDR family NAD(P)-dependent oxidoreductase, partial [Desulfosarcina sp.]|nr:SDR family NAD(P)-dependent oxidoreductase [Desulfosarcina sp.]